MAGQGKLHARREEAAAGERGPGEDAVREPQVPDGPADAAAWEDVIVLPSEDPKPQPRRWLVTGTQPVVVGDRELAPGDEFDQEPPAFLVQIGAVAPKE